MDFDKEPSLVDDPFRRTVLYWERKAVCTCEECSGPMNGYVSGWLSGLETGRYRI